MTQIDYNYDFSDIDSGWSPICCHINNGKGMNYVIQIFEKNVFSLQPPFETSLAFDLIDLAAAVYVADWNSKRRRDMPCHIHISLPLRNPSLFTALHQHIQQELYWFTEDEWSFGFKKRITAPRVLELQRSLLPGLDLKEAALWSGGLDSLAGLCNRLAASTSERYLLVGAGSNDLILHRQKLIACEIAKEYPGRVEVVRVPVRTLSWQRTPKNRLFRIRGFAFMLWGAAVAYLERQHRLCIYENGIGAINLPLSRAELGLDHSRAVHPLSLVRMSRLVSTIINDDFQIENPFLFKTKAQMCKIFAENENLLDLAYQTVSCDRKPRVKGRQCGVCTSCLMRRQALSFWRFSDSTEYEVKNLEQKIGRHDHLKATIQHVFFLASLLSKDDVWNALSRAFPTLFEIEQCLSDSQPGVRDKLIQLYRDYVTEWKNTGGIFDGMFGRNEYR